MLVVVDLICIYPLLRYPPTHCFLHQQNQYFQALYPGYLPSSIHLHLVCSPLPSLSSIPQSSSFSSPLNEPRFYAYTRENDLTPIFSHHAIYELTHPVQEPEFYSSTGPFDEWFGIPFLSHLSFTHVRDPHSTEILTLYGIFVLIPLYPTTLSSLQIRSLVLHILPLPILNHITHIFLYRVVPPIIPSSLQTKCVSVNTQCISNCFTLQPMPASDQ